MVMLQTSDGRIKKWNYINIFRQQSNWCFWMFSVFLSFISVHSPYFLHIWVSITSVESQRKIYEKIKMPILYRWEDTRYFDIGHLFVVGVSFSPCIGVTAIDSLGNFVVFFDISFQRKTNKSNSSIILHERKKEKCRKKQNTSCNDRTISWQTPCR